MNNMIAIGSYLAIGFSLSMAYKVNYGIFFEYYKT